MIFSTLFQALKAIGGGVLALKGQLVKGGGYLLAGKGKVVSKAGDVITSFGKHLAANAQSKPYPPETFYDHPPVQHIGKLEIKITQKKLSKNINKKSVFLLRP